MSRKRDPRFFTDFDVFWDAVERAPNKVESVSAAARVIELMNEWFEGDWSDRSESRRAIARRTFYNFSAELDDNTADAKRAIERLFEDLVQGRELLGEMGPGAFGWQWFEARVDDVRDYVALDRADDEGGNDVEVRKSCSVCGERIVADFAFFITRRFCCRSCHHRTHVRCAADVEERDVRNAKMPAVSQAELFTNLRGAQ